MKYATRTPAVPRRHSWIDDKGNVRDARLVALDIPDQVRDALGRLLFTPEGKVVRRGDDKQYHVFEGDMAISPAIVPEVMQGLLLIRLLKPTLHDPHQAVGEPAFLEANPLWLNYLRDPRRPQRRN